MTVIVHPELKMIPELTLPEKSLHVSAANHAIGLQIYLAEYHSNGSNIVCIDFRCGGIATLWEAVITDEGVALLVILNTVRIHRRKV